MILGWAKTLNTSPEYVLYEISYENMVLYTKAMPYYDDEKDDWDDSIDANNPNNFNNYDKEVFV